MAHRAILFNGPVPFPPKFEMTVSAFASLSQFKKGLIPISVNLPAMVKLL